MSEEEIKKRFEEIEKRIDVLEQRGKVNIKKPKVEDSFSGLSGGIKFLIQNNFLNKPQSVAEIFEELKKEDYHYPLKSVEKLLSINFRKNSKILNRIKEGKKWKYVIRK